MARGTVALGLAAWVLIASRSVLSQAPPRLTRLVAPSSDSCRNEQSWNAQPEWQGLPAASEDGSLVAIPVVSDDGLRAFPNLRLVVQNVRSSAVVYEQPILDTEEIQPTPCDRLRRQIAQRVQTANARLAGTRWVPLARFEVAGRWNTPPQLARVGDGLEIGFRAPRLFVRIPGVRILYEGRPQLSESETDEVHPYLREVYADPTRRVALAVIDYADHRCHDCEIDASYHVFGWSAPTTGPPPSR